jgi:hypothetical protein
MAGRWRQAVSLARPVVAAVQTATALIEAAVEALGAGEPLFTAPLTIAPISTTAFSGGAVAHVFTAHP